jgi:hypothetical protein
VLNPFMARFAAMVAVSSAMNGGGGRPGAGNEGGL